MNNLMIKDSLNEKELHSEIDRLHKMHCRTNNKDAKHFVHGSWTGYSQGHTDNCYGYENLADAEKYAELLNIQSGWTDSDSRYIVTSLQVKTTYTIPMKMSGTGSIHDIASQDQDRVITFAKDCRFAVVAADYYGGKGYTTHKTEVATVKAAVANGDKSFSIIDIEGNTYGFDKYDFTLDLIKQ